MSGAAHPVLVFPTRRTVRNPLEPNRRLGAVLFDLDGTLYHQAPMRCRMAFELAARAVTRPVSTARLCRTLSAYRTAQETLRTSESANAARQVDVAASRTGRT